MLLKIKKPCPKAVQTDINLVRWFISQLNYSLIYQNSYSMCAVHKYATLTQFTHDSLLRIRRKPERSEESPRRRIICFDFLKPKRNQHYIVPES